MLEGELTFSVGEFTLKARPGDFLLGPRGVPHTYTVDAGPARLLFLFAPAGDRCRGSPLRPGESASPTGPGTGNEEPYPAYGATVHVEDAAEALTAALDVPSGLYNVCRDGERVRNAAFKEVSGWRPRA